MIETKEIESILKEFFDQLASEIKSKLPKSTGRTAKEIEVTVKTTGALTVAKLEAPSYIGALEHGRGPTKGGKGSGLTLREQILGWIYERGFSFPLQPQKSWQKTIKNADQLSWAMAISIHKHGTKLFQKGGHSGVLSTVLVDTRIENFIKVFTDKASRIILLNILKEAKKPS